MKRTLIFCGGLVFAAFSTYAVAAPGEYWEISSKMDMPGMPVAMPAQKMKICLPKGGESDPNRTQSKDSHCTFSDIKHSGNTVKFKGTCDNGRGEKMNVSGESTHDSNSFKTKMRMSGTDHGESMDMTMLSSGKRIGGSCDSDEMKKKAQAQESKMQRDVSNMKAEACDYKKSDNLFGNASLYTGPQPMCTNKKGYCKAVSDQAQHDAGSYQELLSYVEQEKQYAAQGSSLVKTCNLNLAGMVKTVCKNSVHRGPQDFMDNNCSPAQAKEYREYARKQACGRDYTSADDRNACLKGERVGRSYTSDDADKSESSKSKGDSVIDKAKTLRGLLPF